LDGKADSKQKGVAHDYKGKCSHLQTSNMKKEVMDESANKLKSRSEDESTTKERSAMSSKGIQ
jgi:hypothetical protein